MRNSEFMINYGGSWLDVDAQSVGGFDFTTLWTLDSTRAVEKGRTMDLSVPATADNTRTFNDHKMIPGEGMRRGINGMVVAGGVNITGTIYVTEYSAARYSLVMVYGAAFGGFGEVNWGRVFPNDKLPFSGKDVPIKTGAIPDFGWYEYGNSFSPHSIVGEPPMMHPSTNLGHVIDSIAAYLGYTVIYPDVSLGRGYQAAAYGLILPAFGNVTAEGTASVSGSAMGGFSYTLTGVGTLAELGLEVSTSYVARGTIMELVQVEVFRATRPVHISIPDNSNVVVFGNTSYDIKNDWEGTQGTEFDLEPGDQFSFARPDEWHKVAGTYYWNKANVPHAFEGNVSVAVSVTRAKSVPVGGELMYLSEAMPEHPLEWWLDAYCNIIFAAWTVDEATKTITVKTYGERLGDALADTDKHIALEKEKMIAVENVKRYIDGFAQHNHTRCAGDYDPSLSVYPFDRDLRMNNDYLPQTRDMEEIPFNDGGIRGGGDGRYYLDLNDVTDDGNGGYNYNGILTVFFENNVNSDGAVHITEILNLGVGLDMMKVDVINDNVLSHPVSYDPDYVVRGVSSGLENACTDITSSTYANIQFVTGDGAESYIYYNFDLHIPVSSVINSVTCKVRYYFGNLGGTVTKQLQVYSGTTPIGTAHDITTANTDITVSLDCAGMTAAQINEAKFRFYAKRGTGSTSTSRYIHIYGAELEVDYTYDNTRHYAVGTAFSTSVRLLLPLFRFAQLDGGSCVSFHGRNFVVKNAKWSEGVAQLELVCIPPQIPEHQMLVKEVMVKNVTCFDGEDGEIQVEAIGGNPPYTYSLNADFSDSNTTGVFTELAVTGPVHEGVDQYGGIVYCYKTIYVRDADGNTAVGAVRLQSPVEFEWLGDKNLTFVCPEGEDSMHMVPGVDFPEPYLSTTANNAETLNPAGYPVGYIFRKGNTYTNIRYDAANDCGDYIVAILTITVI